VTCFFLIKGLKTIKSTDIIPSLNQLTDIEDANNEFLSYYTDASMRFNVPQPFDIMNPARPISELKIYPTQLKYCSSLLHAISTNQSSKPLYANSEFHVKYKDTTNDTLLLVIGESWVYGGSYRDMNNDHTESDLSVAHALWRTMGATAAKLLGADLYQYAYPGNNNISMLYWLQKELPRIKQLGYKTIKVLFQITDVVREMGVPTGIEQMTGKHKHVAFAKHLVTGTHTWDNIAHWLRFYNNYLQRELDELVESNEIDLITWGNFVRPGFAVRGSNTISQSWTQFSAGLEGYAIKDTRFHDATIYNNVFTLGKEDNSAEITEMESIRGYWANSVTGLGLHPAYPSPTSHRLWASEITKPWRGERGRVPSA
jgi:hypothetical protein